MYKRPRIKRMKRIIYAERLDNYASEMPNFTNWLAQQESLAILFVKFVINIVAVRSKKFAQFAQFVVEIT